MPCRKFVKGSDSEAMNASSKNEFFFSAKPIWPGGLAGQMNYMVNFRAIFNLTEIRKATLKIATATLYKAYLNGEFLGYGPARAAKGCFRVDELNITDKLSLGHNILAIEVAVYNAETNYLVTQPEFLQAEAICAGEVLASTMGDGAQFEAAFCAERVQKVPRFSAHRAFMEYYRLQSGSTLWKTNPDYEFDKLACPAMPEKKLLSRQVDYPEFMLRVPIKTIESGTFRLEEATDDSWKPAFTPMVGRLIKGYAPSEYEVNPVSDLLKVKACRKTDGGNVGSCNAPSAFHSGDYRILDFGTNLSGLIGFDIKAETKVKLLLVFDEILLNHDVDVKRAGLNSLIGYELEPGSYRLESFETYSLKYLKILVLDGSCEIGNIYIREYVNPDVYRSDFACSDMKLNRLFEGGRETYRQNAVDLFTDCPSRERGGYLCDSFFTARAGFLLSGNTKVERNFFENYLLADGFDRMPEGMIPMCYPSDPRTNFRKVTPFATFIPNWALWFIVQLEEYSKRSDDSGLVKQLKTRVLGILSYLKPFENEDGLLEGLDGWVFVEWSKANDYVQDVNYPSNMLYAGAMAATGRLYGMDGLVGRSDALKAKIREQSFDGTFFIDNAVRENGKLTVTKNKSEVCQYYAFFFGIAAPETYADLWKALVTEFGPNRNEAEVYPEIGKANAFIGNYLRLELLSRFRMGRQLVRESRDYFLYMVDQTGTLWEHSEDTASCNHGFASHIVYWLYKNVLGVREIDISAKTISIAVEDLDLCWCEGRIPLERGFLSMRWWKEQGSILYTLDVPEGFIVTVENGTDLPLVRK